MVTETVIIGNATLCFGDCRDVLPSIKMVDAVICDPPYSAALHRHMRAMNVSSKSNDGYKRRALGYEHLTADDVSYLAKQFARACSGWIVWMTDPNLAGAVRTEMDLLGRTTFPPLPFYQPGRSVRLCGDGPCSWTDWIVVSRTSAQAKWGTLPGGYVAAKDWNDKQLMGGKPTKLMERLISDYSRRGDLVLDSHMGAGTTGVACARLDRRFIGIERDRDAFALSCQRIEQAYCQKSLFDYADPIATKKQATLQI